MMDFVLQMMEFVLKMMEFVLQMMNFAPRELFAFWKQPCSDPTVSAFLYCIYMPALDSISHSYIIYTFRRLIDLSLIAGCRRRGVYRYWMDLQWFLWRGEWTSADYIDNNMGSLVPAGMWAIVLHD